MEESEQPLALSKLQCKVSQLEAEVSCAQNSIALARKEASLANQVHAETILLYFSILVCSEGNYHDLQFSPVFFAFSVFLKSNKENNNDLCSSKIV